QRRAVFDSFIGAATVREVTAEEYAAMREELLTLPAPEEAAEEEPEAAEEAAAQPVAEVAEETAPDAEAEAPQEEA
ncbi:MAG: hypothetical protein KBI47_14970, partial [Armatimonadetes bacterium]|nr:hypothetical protein [Armatimonadota bacterium]